MAESFFATLECELIERRAFQTQAEARMAIFEYLEGWYNTRRRHSDLGYLSPNDFERAAAAVTHREDEGDRYTPADFDNFQSGNPEAQDHQGGFVH